MPANAADPLPFIVHLLSHQSGFVKSLSVFYLSHYFSICNSGELLVRNYQWRQLIWSKISPCLHRGRRRSGIYQNADGSLSLTSGDKRERYLSKTNNTNLQPLLSSRRYPPSVVWQFWSAVGPSSFIFVFNINQRRISSVRHYHPRLSPVRMSDEKTNSLSFHSDNRWPTTFLFLFLSLSFSLSLLLSYRAWLQ